MTTEPVHQTRVEWVVVDTNVFGRGRLDVAAIEGMAQDLRPVAVEVVVPEVVLWEWADHARTDLETFYADARALRRARLDGLVPGIGQVTGQVPEVEEILAKMTTVLGGLDNVRVLPASEAGALAGVRAQVLRQGAGRRKTDDGEKTGAADTLWIYDGLAMAEHDPNRVVFLTGDSKDVERACKHLKVGAPKVFKDRKDITNALRELNPQAFNTATISQAMLSALWPGGAKDPARVLPGISLEISPGYFSTGEPGVVISANVKELSGLAAVRDVRGDDSILTATLELIGKIDLVRWAPTPEDPTHTVPDEFSPALIQVPVTAHTDDAGQIKRIEAAGVAVVEPSDQIYPDPQSARAALERALGDVPNLPETAWWEKLFRTRYPPVPVDGIKLVRGPRLATNRWEAMLQISDDYSMIISIGPTWTPSAEGVRGFDVVAEHEPIDGYRPDPWLGPTEIAAGIAILLYNPPPPITQPRPDAQAWSGVPKRMRKPIKQPPQRRNPQ